MGIYMEQIKKKEEKPSYWKQSESSLYERRIKPNLQSKKEIAGFSNKLFLHLKENKIQEMANIENSYGTITMGANEKGEFQLLVKEKRRHNERQLTMKEKELQKERVRESSTVNGICFTNSESVKDSAFAYYTKKDITPDKIIKEITQFSEEEKQQSLEQIASFTTIKYEKERIYQLEKQQKITQASNSKEKKTIQENTKKLEEYKQSLWQKQNLEKKVKQAILYTLKEAKQNRKEIDKIPIFPIPLFLFIKKKKKNNETEKEIEIQQENNEEEESIKEK